MPGIGPNTEDTTNGYEMVLTLGAALDVAEETAM